MKLPVVLAVLIGIASSVAATGCSTSTPAEVAPTPNIDATVEARAKELIAAQPTPTTAVVVKEAVPAATPLPTTIMAPEPTLTSVIAEVNVTAQALIELYE